MPDYRENQRIALFDAVNYGVPPARHTHTPRPTQPHRTHAHAPIPRTTGLRVALPALFPDAPSKSPKHPYARLFLDNVRSGATTFDPPPPAQCPECIADDLLVRTRKQALGLPHAHSRIEPDRNTEFNLGPPAMAMGAGPVQVTFCQPGNATSGILVDDILGFNANMIRPGDLPVHHGMGGPIKVTLHIEGPYETVDDILYANCAHRSITRFNLAWWLALAVKHLAHDKFRLGTDGLRLRGLHSSDGVTWTAIARYGI
ncbi:hypothetical protein C8R46DRAFT_1231343 [Mycena filopes]|nr:hypothetical protein C8R46DRAFT_1231343 [Mycena filopes]